MSDEIDAQRVRRFVERHDEPTVSQVLGRFLLPASAAEEVRGLLGPTNRARGRQTAPSNPTGHTVTSGAEKEGAEEENRKRTSRYPGHPTLPGQFDTPPLEIGGGEGGRARIGLRKPRKLPTGGAAE